MVFIRIIYKKDSKCNLCTYFSIKYVIIIALLRKFLQGGKNLKPTIRKTGLSDNSKLFLTIGILCIATRLIIYFMGYTGVVFLEKKDMSFIQSFSNIWSKWDANHYLYLAQNWYTAEGEPRLYIVFYPLYPVIIKVFSVFLHNVFLSSIIVSNVSLIVGCFYLYKLAALDYDEQVSWNSVKYLLIFPFSFFLGAPFTESLFIALTVMTFYYMRKENWRLVGIIGLMAALTRTQGGLLFVGGIFEYCISSNLLQVIKSSRWKDAVKGFSARGIYILLIPMGPLIYLYLNKYITGEWFTFLRYQKEHWHQSFGFIGNVVKDQVKSMFSATPEMKLCIHIPQVVLFVLVLFIIVYGFKKMRMSYLIYMVMYIIMSYSSTWLISGARYMTGLFPIYIGLALICRGKISSFIFTFASVLFLCLYILAFVSGRPVM